MIFAIIASECDLLKSKLLRHGDVGYRAKILSETLRLYLVFVVRAG